MEKESALQNLRRIHRRTYQKFIKILPPHRSKAKPVREGKINLLFICYENFQFCSHKKGKFSCGEKTDGKFMQIIHETLQASENIVI